METTFEKSTLYLRGELLGIVKYEVRSLTVTTGVLYAQHHDAVRVCFVPKGKRKTRSTVLTHNPYVIVVDGWGVSLTPDNPFGAPACGASGVIIAKSRYSSFDPRWESDFDALLEASGIAPALAIR